MSALYILYILDIVDPPSITVYIMENYFLMLISFSGYSDCEIMS